MPQDIPGSSRLLRRLPRLAALILALSVTVLVALPNFLLHLAPTSLDSVDPDRERGVLAQLRFLQGAIAEGAAHDMQRLYPEGFFFQHVLTGLAWCDLALGSADEGLRREAVVAAGEALKAVESDEGTRQFPVEVVPEHGVFWSAWTNLLRGRIVALEGDRADPALVERWRSGLDSLASAYARSDNPYQPSYEGMAWSGDNVMAMLAMATHDRLTRTDRYQSVIRRWVAMVRTSLDPSTGMPPFELDHPSGAVVKPPRGSSQTLFAWALTEIDTAFAREQYLRLRETFFATRLGLPAVLEFPADSAVLADYDSGPVIWGVGSSATIVTLATARRFGDTAFARALESTIRFFGLPVRWRGQTAFALGRMPVADAWIAWSRSSVPSAGMAVPEWNVDRNWTWPVHGLSLLAVLLAWMPWLLSRRRRSSGPTA